jgi:Ser/Thr protein kinase RdoA (MazF antagonist)
LDKTPKAEHGLIHGDFYPEQVLVSEVDQSMGLIDFDRAMLGEQMLDVANFCAWLQFNRHGHSMDATSSHEGVFTGAYFNGQPKSDVRHILDSLVLVQMYRLVVMPFRRWEQDWGNRVFSRLQAVKGKLG